MECGEVDFAEQMNVDDLQEITDDIIVVKAENRNQEPEEYIAE